MYITPSIRLCEGKNTTNLTKDLVGLGSRIVECAIIGRVSEVVVVDAILKTAMPPFLFSPKRCVKQFHEKLSKAHR